jgi:hypothetical protein
MTAIASILRQTARPPNKVLAVCVVDDIATLAAEFVAPRASAKHKAFDIALEAMIEACKRHGDHAELAKLLSHYQACLDGSFDRHMTRGELQDLIDDTTHEIEKCAERIGEAFSAEAYAGSDK